MKKWQILFYTLIFMFICFCPALNVSASTFQVKDTDVTIYAVDSMYEGISLPDGYAGQYQIQVEGTSETPKYEIMYTSAISQSDFNRYAAKVSATGLVTPQNGQFGSVVVRVTVGTEHQDISIHVKDYLYEYGQSIIDEFVKKNINSSMSVKEIALIATEYAASFSYDYKYGSAESMVILGGGDCIASTDLIMKVCQKAGVKVWGRKANKDRFAGSGHVNAMVEDAENGVWYQCDAGTYVDINPQTGLRTYSFDVRTTLFSYRRYSTGEIRIYQYDGIESPTSFTLSKSDKSDSPVSLVIPEKLDGYTVDWIDDKVFQNFTNLEEITIPDTIKKIGDNVFAYCKNLKSFHISKNITSIGSGAFSGCDSLSEFTIDQDNPNYTIIDGILYNKEVTELLAAPYVSSIQIPDEVTQIDENALINHNLLTLSSGDGITEFPRTIFFGCDNLETLYIGKNVATIDYFDMGAFAKVRNFYVDEDNLYFQSIDGVLFSKDGKTLIRYSSGNEREEYVIPNGVEDIGFRAFYFATSIKKLVMPNSVIKIEDFAFHDTGAIEEIIFSENLISIGSYVFYISSVSCKPMEQLIIPASVKEIGSSVFCGTAKKYYIFTTDATIGQWAFSAASLYIIEGSTMDAYTSDTNILYYVKKYKSAEDLMQAMLYGDTTDTADSTIPPSVPDWQAPQIGIDWWFSPSYTPEQQEFQTGQTVDPQEEKAKPINKSTKFNIKNKKTYKKSKKVTIKNSDGIKMIKLNGKKIKIKSGQKSVSFKLSKYQKYLKQKNKWNKISVTDMGGRKQTIKFKVK